MADRLSAKNSDAKFTPHPEGMFPAQCVDVIDLGEKVEEYQNNPKKLSHKCALVFRTGEINVETGEPIDVSGEYTVSMGEKAKLRQMLETWRGKEYSEDELEEVPLDKLEGQWALLTIDQKVSSNKRRYARIIGITGIPKQMRKDLPTFGKYERAKYWTEKKETYKKDAEAFLAMISPVPSGRRLTGPTDDDSHLTDEDFRQPDDDELDSGLPF